MEIGKDKLDEVMNMARRVLEKGIPFDGYVDISKKRKLFWDSASNVEITVDDVDQSVVIRHNEVEVSNTTMHLIPSEKRGAVRTAWQQIYTASSSASSSLQCTFDWDQIGS